MNEQTPQPQVDPVPIEPPSTLRQGRIDTPKPKTPRARWLIFAILLLAILGFDMWILFGNNNFPSLVLDEEIKSPISAE